MFLDNRFFRCLRRTSPRKENKACKKEVQKVPKTEGLQETKEVHAALAVGLQVKVFHADPTAAGRLGADSRHYRVRGVLLRPVCRRLGPPEEPSQLTVT